MAKWTLELLDYAGVAIGELQNASARKFTDPLNAPKVSTGQIRLDNDLAPDVLDLARLLRCKRNGVLVGMLPLQSGEEVASEGIATIPYVATDPLGDILADRLIGKGVDAKGKGVGYAQGTALLPVVRGQIAKAIIDVTNAADGFTGVATDNTWITDASTGYVGPWYFKQIAEAILEMSATLDGYDFEIRPTEPVDIGFGAANPKIAEFRTYVARGSAKPDVIFEYGFGKTNLRGYRRPRTIADLLNRAYSLPQGFPDAAVQLTPPDANGNGDTYQTVVANDYDASASVTKWKLREGVVSGDLTVDAFRKTLCNEHVRIRRNPREQIIIELASNIEYDYGVDYGVGDIVTARAKVNDVMRFDATFRIYAVNFDIDENGNEAVSLTVIPS